MLPSVAVAVSAIRISLLLSCTTAIRATYGFICETLLSVESLLTFGENKLCAAILTS